MFDITDARCNHEVLKSEFRPFNLSNLPIYCCSPCFIHITEVKLAVTIAQRWILCNTSRDSPHLLAAYGYIINSSLYWVCMCVFLCVCVNKHKHTPTHTNTHLYLTDPIATKHLNSFREYTNRFLCKRPAVRLPRQELYYGRSHFPFVAKYSLLSM